MVVVEDKLGKLDKELRQGVEKYLLRKCSRAEKSLGHGIV